MQLKFFFNLSAEISTVLCDNQNKAETLLQTREKGQTPVLKTVVIMDSFDSALVERGTKCGVDIVSMQDVEVLHAENKQLCLYWLRFRNEQLFNVYTCKL